MKYMNFGDEHGSRLGDFLLSCTKIVFLYNIYLNQLYFHYLSIHMYDIKVIFLEQQSPAQNADSDSEEEKPRRIRHKAYGLNYEIKVISGTLAKMRVMQCFFM